MYKGIYIGIRAVVAILAFVTLHRLFFVPPSIESGVGGNEYSSCHPVAWNFRGDLVPLSDDAFDVENPDDVQAYVDGAVSYKLEVKDAILRRVHEACKEARHERGIVIIVASIFFAVVFLSVPKPRRSRNGAGTREMSNGAGQNAVAGGEDAAFMTGEKGTALGDGNETDFRRGTESN